MITILININKLGKRVCYSFIFSSEGDPEDDACTVSISQESVGTGQNVYISGNYGEKPNSAPSYHYRGMIDRTGAVRGKAAAQGLKAHFL